MINVQPKCNNKAAKQVNNLFYRLIDTRRKEETRQ